MKIKNILIPIIKYFARYVHDVIIFDEYFITAKHILDDRNNMHNKLK